MVRVYYDNVIVSALVFEDIKPVEEMEAVCEIERLHVEGRLKRVTSRESHREQAKTADTQRRMALESRQAEVSAVQADHFVPGYSTIDYGALGHIANRIVSDINDPELFEKLKAAGLKASDAKHVMYAVTNDCQYFVTMDTRDLLPNKAAIESICPIRVVKPSELVAQF
jgi:hypothetical protein